MRSYVARLRSRIALALLLVAVASALFLAWGSGAELREGYDEAARSEAVAIARSFEAGYSETDLENPVALQRRIEALRARNPRVEEAWVYARTGHLLLRLASTDRGELRAPIDPAYAGALEGGRIEFREEREGGKHLAELAYPLREGGRRPTAAIALRIDLGARDAALANVVELAVAAAAAAFLLALAMALLMSRAVFGPLRQLRMAAERISGGELETRLHWHRSDELGKLGKAFDRMADSLESNRAEVQGQNARLQLQQGIQTHALKVVERLSAQNESILNSAGQGICGLDREGRAVLINRVAAEMLGYDAHELIGQSLHRLVHHKRPDGSAYPEEECPVSAALREGVVRRASDEVYWRKDGSSFPVEYTATPIIEEGERAGAVVVFDDITERRELERMKDEFTSVVSHELRTPLTSIRGSLGLLAGGVLGPIPEKGRRMLEIAIQNTDRLVRLINDILDVERIQAGKVKMERQHCEAANLMQDSVEAVEAMAHEHGVIIAVSPAKATLWADPDRIVQTLTNLLSNAIKFSPPGASVWLSAEPSEEELMFVVTDAGRGVPEDKLETIFERFEQVDASDSREKGGTGLGLPICRSIVSQHGGRIWATSTVGEGSTFCFTLPMPRHAPPGDEPLTPGAPAVLVCDDDPSVVEVVAALLRQRGYRALSAASGAEALEQAASERPAVILLDLLMPGLSGWATAAALKERRETRDIPIVILSGLAARDTRVPEAEAVDWVDKPIDEESLFGALERALLTASSPCRVLVVEDDLAFAEVLVETFERHGVEALRAATGREAVELSRRFPPDLLVLDLALPDGDGFALADELHRDDGLGACPLVVYTARELDDAERQRLELGETDVLAERSIALQDLEERVLELLDRITDRPTEESSLAE